MPCIMRNNKTSSLQAATYAEKKRLRLELTPYLDDTAHPPSLKIFLPSFTHKHTMMKTAVYEAIFHSCSEEDVNFHSL